MIYTTAMSTCPTGPFEVTEKLKEGCHPHILTAQECTQTS